MMISGEYIVANILTSSNKDIYRPSLQVPFRLLISISFLSTNEVIVDSGNQGRDVCLFIITCILVIIIHSCCLQ